MVFSVYRRCLSCHQNSFIKRSMFAFTDSIKCFVLGQPDLIHLAVSNKAAEMYLNRLENILFFIYQWIVYAPSSSMLSGVINRILYVVVYTLYMLLHTPPQAMFNYRILLQVIIMYLKSTWI